MSFRRNNPKHGSGYSGKQPNNGNLGVDFEMTRNSKERMDKVGIEHGDLPAGNSDPVSTASLNAILEVIHNPSGLKPRHRR